ncbi:hypothetical protein Tco_0517803, partial [Tanacetum coccineum]
LRFLNFFNDPRIIREQRIAAYKGYRGGGRVEGLVGDVWELWCYLEGVHGGNCTWVDLEMGQKKGASFTQRMISSISVGGSINLEGFLSSILLSVVIIVMVVIVVVILIVVVVDDVPFILKLSFVIIDWACAFHQDKASSVKVPVAYVTLSSSAYLLQEKTDSFPLFTTGISLGSVFLLEFSEFAMAAACAFRAEEIPSLISCRMASKVMIDVSNVEGDGDNDTNDGDDDERER